MPERIFLTFADSKMELARRRICRQAKKMNAYTQIIGASEENLDPQFRELFKQHLIKHSRGFGYMCWKPQIVRQTLETMQDGDLLHWVDSGSHMNPRGRWRLLQYFSMADVAPTGILAFQCVPPAHPFQHDGRDFPDLPDRKWTKGDLLDRLGVRTNHDLLNEQSIGTCTFMIRKCPASVAFVDEWLSIPKENFAYIDDSPSVSQNLEGFVEHRHDQSIFSILAKLRNASTISMYECWYPFADDCETPDWSKVKDYPIQIRRDRGYPGKMGLALLRAKGKVKRLLDPVLEIPGKIQNALLQPSSER